MLKAHVSAYKYHSSKTESNKFPKKPDLSSNQAFNRFYISNKRASNSFFTTHGHYDAVGRSEISDLGVRVAGPDGPHHEISPTNRRGPRSAPRDSRTHAQRNGVRTSHRRDLRRHAADLHRRHLELSNVRENRILFSSAWRRRGLRSAPRRFSTERETPAELEAPRGGEIRKGTIREFCVDK